jgi:hypothetical protein
VTLHLYDGIAVVRRALETDVMGRVPRRIMNDMLSLPPRDVAVWCWDGAGAKTFRQGIFAPYKAKREPQPDGVWKTIQLIRDVLKHTRAMQVTVPTYEADDLIAHYARSAPRGTAIMIHSVDRDLSALMVNPDVKASFGEGIKGVPPEWVPLFKLTVGDSSDEIPGTPGFGRKTWDKIAAAGLLQQLHDVLLECETKPFAAIPPATGVLLLLPKRCQSWLNEQGATLRAMRKVIAFREVTDPIKVVVGVPDAAKGDAILKEFLL